jgi:hypothetical protein
MKPTIKAKQQNTYHRDGTVSYWSVYTQCWERRPANSIPRDDLAAMNADERLRVESAKTGYSLAELRDIRADARANDTHDRRAYAEMTQAERDAHDNL